VKYEPPLSERLDWSLQQTCPACGASSPSGCTVDGKKPEGLLIHHERIRKSLRRNIVQFDGTDRQLLREAMHFSVTCPECKRTGQQACKLPTELERQGVFIHASRIAAGDFRTRRSIRYGY
jgi:hypothetical protein